MNTVNIGLLAHVDAGKTTLTEQLLYAGGAVRSAGSVDKGTAKTDFLEIEKQRGISVVSGTARIELADKNTAINLIDTPGHADFSASVERALYILDAAVLVVSAVEGIEAQTELIIDALLKMKTPTIVFINKIDRTGSNCRSVLQELKKQGLSCLLRSEVENEGSRDSSVKNRRGNLYFEELCECIADADDFAMKYLEDNVTENEAKQAFYQLFLKGEAVPVFCGSAQLGTGVSELLSFIADMGGGASTLSGKAAWSGKAALSSTTTSNGKTASYGTAALQDKTADCAGPLSGIVYKVTHDKSMGKIAHLRLFSGEIKSRGEITVSSYAEKQKVTQVRRYTGEKFTDIGVLTAGDVGAVCGLSHVKAGDTVGELLSKQNLALSTPFLSVQAALSDGGDIRPLIAAFEELSDEEPSLSVQYESGEQELIISVTGKIQLEILTAVIKERFGLDVSFSPPTVIYKETIQNSGTGFDAYTMPKPCWAVVSLDFVPLPLGSGFVYDRGKVPNDQMFYRYQRHVETAVKETLKQGLYGWEVTDLKITLTGGEHHTVHTHPLDFFLCTPIAVMKGLKNCGTRLLEPYQRLTVSVPEEFSGKIIGDMISMRGVCTNQTIADGRFLLEAEVPAAESLDYSVELLHKTAGKGTLKARFIGYRPCPEGFIAETKRRGVNPLDRDKWILTRRSAMGQ